MDAEFILVCARPFCMFISCVRTVSRSRTAGWQQIGSGMATVRSGQKNIIPRGKKNEQKK